MMNRRGLLDSIPRACRFLRSTVIVVENLIARRRRTPDEFDFHACREPPEIGRLQRSAAYPHGAYTCQASVRWPSIESVLRRTELQSHILVESKSRATTAAEGQDRCIVNSDCLDHVSSHLLTQRAIVSIASQHSAPSASKEMSGCGAKYKRRMRLLTRHDPYPPKGTAWRPGRLAGTNRPYSWYRLLPFFCTQQGNAFCGQPRTNTTL